MVIALGIIRVYDSNIRIESALERNLMENEKQSNHRHEEPSRRYLDGRYFVPAREQQMHIVHFFHTGHALFSGWEKNGRGKKRGKW